MTGPNIVNIVEHLADQPALPTIRTRVPGDGARGPSLPQTRAILTAASLTADAEMRSLGIDAQRHGNPIEQLLNQGGTSPFYRRLRDAIEAAAAANAFGPTAIPGAFREPTLTRGARVRARPFNNDIVGLPTDITVGSIGLLLDPEEYSEPGWRVRFDIHGTWWTPTNTLEAE
jgi:hypothetical protein